MSNIFHIHDRAAGVDGTAGDNIIRAQFRSGAGRAGEVMRAFARAWSALRAWHNRRIAVRELSAMPDALLRDIGIERYQIRAAVNGAYPGIIRLPRAGVVNSGGEAVAAVAEVKQAA